MSTSQAQPLGLNARGMEFAIVVTRWNERIVEQLLTGAQAALKEAGAATVRTYRCAGAFELAPLCARVVRKGGVDGIIALGCLIRGGTDHYRVLADETTRALGMIALEGATSPRPLALAFGVLTCDTVDQAEERAELERGNKGGEAAQACIEQIHALRAVGPE